MIDLCDEKCFDACVRRDDRFALVAFSAAGSGPATLMSEVVAVVGDRLADRIRVLHVRADASPRLADRFDVQAVPALLMLWQGEVVAHQTGAAPLDVVEAWVLDQLARHPAGRLGLRPVLTA